MSLPYLPLFVDDYEADTAHLSLVEDGIYSRLLRLCWRSPKCRMPNDHDWIARKIRVSSDEERAAMAAVLTEFFTARRNVIFNKRLSAEYERISVSVERRKNAGKIGGLSKSLKLKKIDTSNASALPKHPEPYPKKKPNGFLERASAPKKSSRIDKILEGFASE